MARHNKKITYGEFYDKRNHQGFPIVECVVCGKPLFSFQPMCRIADETLPKCDICLYYGKTVSNAQKVVAGVLLQADWQGFEEKCQRCDVYVEVLTTTGCYNLAFDDDEVKCVKCGAAGRIVCDGESAAVEWDDLIPNVH